MASLGGIALSYGLWAMGGTLALLALFWLLRGRIRIEKGWAGFNVVRFGRLERFAHWLLAASFLILALPGLSLRYRSTVLGRLLGDESSAGLLWIWVLHLGVALVFMASLLLALLLWVRHSLPHWRDALWLVKGGGMIVRGVHPPAHKFNAGQKLLFWLVILGGVWLSFSGLLLVLPHEPIPEYEAYRTAWHSVPALVLICAVIVHIYMRTVGIQGAASAMTSGEVDANWARQHHSLWAETEVKCIEDAAEADAGETAAARTP
jgi:formate dehydrogenase subunit gamma